MTPTSKRLHVLAAAVLSFLAFSCQVPEAEREPEILDIIPSKTNPSALESSITAQVRCDLHWSVELEDSSWGTVKVNLVNEGSGGSITFEMGVNTSEDPRENTIIVKAGKGEIRKTITQGGVGSLFSPRSLVLTGTQEAAVTFTSPEAWTAQVADGADWLDLKTPSGEKGTNRLTVAPKDANENVGSRQGTVRVTIGGNSFDIAVAQGQTDVILTGDTALSFPFEAQEFGVATRFNVEYKVEVTVPWITRATTKAPLYEGQENFVVEENSGAQARSGEIRFTGGNAKPLVITVSQEGKDPILNSTQMGFYGVDGHDYIFEQDGWNQCTRLLNKDLTVRYRLLNAASLSVIELSGIGTQLQKGDAADAHLTLKTKLSTRLTKDYQAVFCYEENGLRWYKVDETTYFVVSF